VKHVAHHATGDVPVRESPRAYDKRIYMRVIGFAVCAALLWAVLVQVLGLPHPSAAHVDDVLELSAPPGSFGWVREHGARRSSHPE